MYKTLKKYFLHINLSIFIFFSMPIFLSSPNSSAFAATMEENSFTRIYEKITPSIVAIDAQVDEGVSSGTGCVIDPKGAILTSSHVISKAKNIEVTISNGQTYKGEVVAVLKDKNDLAIIKINPKKPLPVISFGNSENVKVGQRVLAIGNPFGFRGTLTTGIISRIDYQRKKIQTDAAINPGCSGGPLLNLDGEVIGINQSIYNPDNNRSNIGIGFAVPVNYAKDFINLTRSKMASIEGTRRRWLNLFKKPVLKELKELKGKIIS